MKRRNVLPIPPWAALTGTTLCAALVWAGRRWPQMWLLPDTGPEGILNPFVEVLKLIIAASIGTLVTWVHQHGRAQGPKARAGAHAQILFCVAGALAMIIIGNSTARAFGAFGIASIVRFRSALKDPEDATIMFLLIGLGMGVGRGLFDVAGLGTIFLCLLLWTFERLREEGQRAVMFEVKAEGSEFPTVHVQQVFARHRIVAEPREGDEKKVTYYAKVRSTTSPEELTAELVAEGKAGVKSVKWEAVKLKE